MQKRKKTPDILSTLMDKQTQDAGKPVSQHTSIPEPAEKVKATYYLSQATVDDLEDAWYQLRKESSPEAKGEISKSLIVDTALRIAFEELRNQGTESQLASKLLYQDTSVT